MKINFTSMKSATDAYNSSMLYASKTMRNVHKHKNDDNNDFKSVLENEINKRTGNAFTDNLSKQLHRNQLLNELLF